MFSGSKIKSANHKGANAIHYAVKDEKIHSICRLIEMGCSVNWTDNNQKTPLHYAAANGNLQIGELLVQLGAHLNPVDYKGRTPAALAEDKEKFMFSDTLAQLGAVKLKRTQEIHIDHFLDSVKKEKHTKALLKISKEADSQLEDINSVYRKFYKNRS